ncbi:addiction module toxin RelE [Spirochaetia bacterium]|nr:addiction module toxin RelE [Spirochaetia bacterium]
MRVFKNSRFSRFAGKEAISDQELRTAAKDIEAGHFDADLGGHVYKQRIARPGEGKSGGYRVVVFFKRGERTFFTYGFPKSERDNISDKELRYYRKLARDYLAMTENQLDAALKAGEFIELLEDIA